MGYESMIVVARRPTHPGEILREEFLPDFGLSIAALATCIQVSRQSINELVRERRSVSTDMAIRLGKLFGTSPQYWLNLQRSVDIWEALDEQSDAFEAIKPLEVSA